MPSLCAAGKNFQLLDARNPTIVRICLMENKHMDVAYLALVAVFWLLLVGMAVGCAKLGGPKQ